MGAFVAIYLLLGGLCEVLVVTHLCANKYSTEDRGAPIPGTT